MQRLGLFPWNVAVGHVPNLQRHWDAPMTKCPKCSGYGWVLGTHAYAVKCKACNGTGRKL